MLTLLRPGQSEEIALTGSCTSIWIMRVSGDEGIL